jgi:hypothetical protein
VAPVTLALVTVTLLVVRRTPLDVGFPRWLSGPMLRLERRTPQVVRGMLQVVRGTLLVVTRTIPAVSDPLHLVRDALRVVRNALQLVDDPLHIGSR